MHAYAQHRVHISTQKHERVQAFSNDALNSTPTGLLQNAQSSLKAGYICLHADIWCSASSSNDFAQQNDSNENSQQYCQH